MGSTKNHGFTLIELIITVAVIGILVAVALPSYRQYVVKSNRSAAESFMMTVANKEEQYMLGNSYYAGDVSAGSALSDLGLSLPSQVSGYYAVTVACTTTTAIGNCSAVAGAPGYTITATPSGSQASDDTKCATLTLNQQGAKTMSGTATALSDCW